MTQHVLYTFERKILRIYGWRCRWNSKIYRLYKDLNIVDDIKIRRLRWGPVASLEWKKTGSKKKKNLKGKFYNKRPIAKPRIRCEGAVQKNALQVLGIRGWRRRAGDREDRGAF
jgi:hypothetical protein